MAIFDNPNSMLEEDVNDLFKTKSRNEVDILFETINLILYKNQKNTDMVQILKVFGIETFVKLIQLFDGKTVRFMKDKEMTDALTLAIVYYFKRIKGINDWEKIQEFFGNKELDRLSLSHKVHGLDQFTKQKLLQLMGKEGLSPDEMPDAFLFLEDNEEDE